MQQGAPETSASAEARTLVTVALQTRFRGTAARRGGNDSIHLTALAGGGAAATTIDVRQAASGDRRQNDQVDGRCCNWRSSIRGRPCRGSDASARCAEGASGVDTASLSGRGRASAGRKTVLSAPPLCYRDRGSLARPGGQPWLAKTRRRS